jgi:hypothetical protein
MAVSRSMFFVQYLTIGDEGHGDHRQAAVDPLSDELSSPSQRVVESPVAEKAQRSSGGIRTAGGISQCRLWPIEVEPIRKSTLFPAKRAVPGGNPSKIFSDQGLVENAADDRPGD